MKKNLWAIALILLSLNLKASSPTKLWDQQGKMFRLTKFKKVSLSATSLCQKGECQAAKTITAANSSIAQNILVGAGGMNPASSLCRTLKGRPWFLQDREGNQYSCCFFKDRSFFLSWDLFYKLFKK